MDLTLATISAMCRQEESVYAVASTTQATAAREKMAAWCYRVVDFWHFRRETVEVAMNYLDRFVVSKEGQQANVLEDHQVYQLAAMACFYTAVKINEPVVMDSTSLACLSRGAFSAQQIEQMEVTILQALKWRVNPPTAMSFVRNFLELLPTLTSVLKQSGQSETVYNLTEYQTELAVVRQADFVAVQQKQLPITAVRASTIAFCALMNSLESAAGLHPVVLLQISNSLLQSIGLYSCATLNCSCSAAADSSSGDGDCNNDLIWQIRNRLYEAVVLSGQQQPESKLHLSLQRPSNSFGTHENNNNNMRTGGSSSSSKGYGCETTSPRSIATAHSDLDYHQSQHQRHQEQQQQQ